MGWLGLDPAAILIFWHRSLSLYIKVCITLNDALCLLGLVLATGPNSLVGSGSGSTRTRTVATGLTTRKTRHIGNGPVLLLKTRHFNTTTLPPIKYLSSDRIMTWSVRRLCSSSRSFTSQSQICDPTNVCSVAIENPLISLKICHFFTTTQRISVGSQIGQWEVKERPELHNLRTDHVTIRWELRYLIGGQGVGTVKLEPRSGSNPAENPWVYVLSGQRTHHDKVGWVFGQVWNWTELNRWAKTGPLAGYPDPLLSLVMLVFINYHLDITGQYSAIIIL